MITLCSESLELARGHGNRHGVAAALDALGRLAHARGEQADAVVLYRSQHRVADADRLATRVPPGS